MFLGACLSVCHRWVSSVSLSARSLLRALLNPSVAFLS